MARDYKHRAQPKAKKKQQASCWVWLIAGFLLGAISVGLTWLKLGTDAVTDNQWISDRPAQSEAKTSRPVVPPPKFDFYDRLPEMEVVVPDEELPASRPASPDSPAQPEGPFLIQVGSFKKAADADRLKAQLTLQGMAVRVSRVKIDDGDTWHRVRVGPYSSRKALDEARQRLADNGLRGIVIRAAGG
jgi:cell division protein FtsN